VTSGGPAPPCDSALPKPCLNRYLRVTADGLLRIDHAAIKAEERLDGKYLLRCCDPKLSAEDIALGYKQLLEVERGWRDMKSTLDLRPVFHRREDRIVAWSVDPSTFEQSCYSSALCE
jgi:transposase